MIKIISDYYNFYTIPLKKFVNMVDNVSEKIKDYLQNYPYLFEKLDMDILNCNFVKFHIMKEQLDKNLIVSKSSKQRFKEELLYIQKDFIRTLEQIKKMQQWEQLKRKFINLITFWRRSLWQQ